VNLWTSGTSGTGETLKPIEPMEIVELDPIKPMDNIGTSRNSELEQFYQSAITETIGAT
jgi:hypothetical protein